MQSATRWGEILPLRFDVAQRHPDQLVSRLITGKVAFVPDRLVDRCIEAFNGVGRVDDLSDLKARVSLST